MKIETEIVLPGVYALTFETQYELCMSFVRIQEFYESPKFRGKYFTLERFIDYWATEFGNGSFDYPAKWHGFNLPNNVIDKWRKKFNGIEDGGGISLQLQSDTLTYGIRSRERELLSVINEIRNTEEYFTKKYYVVGLHAELSKSYREEVIAHECAHALYYLYPAYKRAADKLLKETSQSKKDRASKNLLKIGYGNAILKDEMQAYFSTESTRKMSDSLPGLLGIKKFAQNFAEYRRKWIEKFI